MSAVDYQMPIVVQQRRQKESADCEPGFIDFDFTAGRPVIVQERKFISALENSAENFVRSEWRTLLKQNSNGIFRRNEIVVSPESYFILETPNVYESRSFLHKKTSVFPKIENVEHQIEFEEESFSDVRPMAFQHQTLFTQEVEFRTSELEHWRPNIVIEDLYFEDEE